MNELLGGGTARRAGAPQGLAIVVAGFLPIMAIVSLAPAIPRLISHFGGGPNTITLVPLLVTAPGLLIALCSPGMGWIMDRLGRRPILLGATLLYGVLGLSPLIFTSLPQILISRLGLGVCEAAIMTATNALLGDYFEPGRRRTWLTVQGVAGPIFATVVILASGAITETIWNGAFAIYVVALPIFLAMLLFVFEPPRVIAQVEHPDVPHLPFPWTAVATYSAVTLFASILYYVGSVQMGLVFTADGVTSPKTVGLLISIASLGVPLGSLLFGAVSLRLKQPTLIAILLALLGLGMIGVSLVHDTRLTVGLAFIQQVGAGMTVPTLVFWATRALDVRNRGRGMGFWSSAFFFGQFISPVVVGYVRGLVGGGILPAFMTLGVVSTAGAIVSIVIGMRRSPPRPGLLASRVET